MTDTNQVSLLTFLEPFGSDILYIEQPAEVLEGSIEEIQDPTLKPELQDDNVAEIITTPADNLATPETYYITYDTTYAMCACVQMYDPPLIQLQDDNVAESITTLDDNLANSEVIPAVTDDSLSFTSYFTVPDQESSEAITPLVYYTFDSQDPILNDNSASTDIQFFQTANYNESALIQPLSIPNSFRIHEIQGAGLRSALEGTTVTNVTGIVTVLASNGFYLQDPNPDNNAATSEGIFVFTSSRPTVSVGDSIRLDGRVVEFSSGGNQDNQPITQLDRTANINVLSKNNELPEAIVIGAAGRKPPTESFYPEGGGIFFYESLEGMRVTVKDAMAVGATLNFATNAQIWTVSDQGKEATGINSRDGITISPGDFNPERILINDALFRGLVSEPGDNNPRFTIPTVNVGDLLGDVTGVVSYGFGNYQVLMTEPFLRSPGGLQREVTNIVGTEDRLTIASYNVENLNPFSGVRFDDLARQIINNLKAPDIIALQEIQDNNGPINDGVVNGDLTYQTLIKSIVAFGGPTYQFVNIDPENNRDGGQPGSNIRVGYLYNPERVGLVAGSVRRITDPNVTEEDDVDAFQSTRKPLVATFTFNGEEVTTINNHFTSRGGSNPLFGTTQPPVVAGVERRNAQAQVISDEIDKILATDPTANVVVLGDLNSFDFEQPAQILKGLDAPVLKNLNETLPQAERYTFNFQGNSQPLDHLLVSNHLAADAKYDIVHVNVDFAEQPADHEPIVASLNLPKTQPPTPKTFTLQILHASDQEAGVPAFRDIPGFSAVLNALDGKYANTIKLTSGDLYISSPFFNASQDIYDNASTGNPANQAGIADILIQNELGWDAASLGNHEFSGGDSNFFNLVASNPNWVNGTKGGVGIGAGGYPGTLFPYLANNVDYSNVNLPSRLSEVANGGAPLPNSLTGSVVEDVNGEKVGIIGVVTPYLASIASIGRVEVTTKDANGNNITPSTPISVQVDSIIANIKPEIEALTSKGVNKIILMTHLQESPIEQALAQKLASLGLPVDVLIGGGAHRVMSSSTGMPPLRDDETQQITGDLIQPYPQPFTSADRKNTVYYVKTAANYRYLGQLIANFDEKGVITSIGDGSGPYATDIAGVDRLYTENITTLDQVKAKADPEVVKILEGVRSFVNAQDANVFGQTNVFLNGVRGDVRTQETNLGNLSSDSRDYYAEAYLKENNNLLPGFNKIDISFGNGGSIRDSIGQPDVEVLTSNLLSQLSTEANPEVGKEAGDVSQLDIANSLRFDSQLVVGTVTAAGFLQLAEHMVSAVELISGRFGQIGGFKFSFDPDAAAGNRVQSLALTDETGKSVTTIVKNGELAVDPNRIFSVVTSAFLATESSGSGTGGDGYPLVIKNVVRLADLDDPASLGKSNLASGGEQDALAEYLAASYNKEKGQAPFSKADTPRSQDERVQNLNFRQDTVLDGIGNPPPRTVFGTPGDDTFDSVAPGQKNFVGDNQILSTGSGNDTVDVTFAPGGNRIDTGSDDDLIFAGTNNRIIAGTGDDLIFFGKGGNNLVTGGQGADQFWLVSDTGELPTTANTISDFNLTAGDVLGFANTSLDFDSLTLVQSGSNTLIKGLGRDLAILSNVRANSLNESAFVFA